MAMALISTSPALAGKTLVVPNCSWAGWEADLLIIDGKLRIIDVEIKISRSDLKADLKKDKWWRFRPWSRRTMKNDAKGRQRRSWPDKAWKHYYALPREIWTEALIPSIPACSGIILVSADARYSSGYLASVYRAAVPNRDAKPISPADAIDIARLASLRMWAALRKELK
jgi:hypothetical protein